MAKLTIKQLRTRPAYEIAEQLGLSYSGDCSPIPHGGVFYETYNWAEYGYSNCVRIQESEGRLWVDCLTVNKPNSEDDRRSALESSGWKFCDDTDAPGLVSQSGGHPTELTADIEIDALLNSGGYEVDTGEEFKSDNGKSWGDFPEFKIWQYAKPHIVALTADRPTPVKMPSLGELRRLFIELKKTIGDDYRADDDSETPSMSVTIGWSDKTGDWSYQTGDNSFTGGAYHYPHWAVITLDRRSNSAELASDAIAQLSDLSAV